MGQISIHDWLANYNRKALNNPGLTISPILVKLKEMAVDELDYSICRFVTEAQHAKTVEYPPGTLKSLVLMSRLYLRSCHSSFKFLCDKHS